MQSFWGISLILDIGSFSIECAKKSHRTEYLLSTELHGSESWSEFRGDGRDFGIYIFAGHESISVPLYSADRAPPVHIVIPCISICDRDYCVIRRNRVRNTCGTVDRLVLDSMLNDCECYMLNGPRQVLAKICDNHCIASEVNTHRVHRHDDRSGSSMHVCTVDCLWSIHTEMGRIHVHWNILPGLLWSADHVQGGHRDEEQRIHLPVDDGRYFAVCCGLDLVCDSGIRLVLPHFIPRG